VISFGAASRGAVTGRRLGVSDVTVLTQRRASAVASLFASVRLLQFQPADLAPVTDVLTSTTSSSTASSRHERPLIS
jgi:hypothetical protein